MLKWMRLPKEDAAGQNSNDTTEVQIGSGLTVPDWAKSIRALHAHLVLLAVTTKESVSGYIRLDDDSNVLDPLSFPLPCFSVLTGAIAVHNGEASITVPVCHDVPKNDTIRSYFAFDAATTGVHTAQAFVAFSSHAAPFNLKAEKSAVMTHNTTANAEVSTAKATISTLADRTAQIMGFWNYVVAPTPTAAQTAGGYVKIRSSVAGWQEQEMPTNMTPSGLSTQIDPWSRPMVMVTDELRKFFSGVHKLEYEGFNCNTKQDFNFSGIMDGTNTVAPIGRYGMIWREK